ncbi:hypothetical protein HDU93_006903 [Gonapodya sp. JEL0774]|nr:hypothetical protein HDU93_006903 [Gonapodya sp. JEL0774]
MIPKKKKPSLMERRAVIMEPGEKRIYTLMQQLNTIREEKLTKRKEKKLEKQVIRKRIAAKEEKITLEITKTKRKESFRAKGLKEDQGGPRKKLRVK